MEGIGDGNFIGDGFRSSAGGFRLGRLGQFAAKGIGNIFNLRLVGQGFEQALAEDVVDFVGSEVNRGDIPLLPPQLRAGIGQGTVD